MEVSSSLQVGFWSMRYSCRSPGCSGSSSRGGVPNNALQATALALWARPAPERGRYAVRFPGKTTDRMWPELILGALGYSKTAFEAIAT